MSEKSVNLEAKPVKMLIIKLVEPPIIFCILCCSIPGHCDFWIGNEVCIEVGGKKDHRQIRSAEKRYWA
jgi:hypothetical protein